MGSGVHNTIQNLEAFRRCVLKCQQATRRSITEVPFMPACKQPAK
jgi:hypothetical protein